MAKDSAFVTGRYQSATTVAPDGQLCSGFSRKHEDSGWLIAA
jgi:hypothetical protein